MIFPPAMDDSYYFQETPVERINLLKGGVKERLEAFRQTKKRFQIDTSTEASASDISTEDVKTESLNLDNSTLASSTLSPIGSIPTFVPTSTSTPIPTPILGPSNDEAISIDLQQINLEQFSNTTSYVPSVFDEDCINEHRIDFTANDTDDSSSKSGIPTSSDALSDFIAFNDDDDSPSGALTLAQLLTEMERISPPGLPIWSSREDLSELSQRQWLPIFDQLHEEILDFVQYVSPSTRELQLRADLIARYQAVVRSIWPDATLRPFGSLATGLSLPFSDADMILSKPCSRAELDFESERVRQLTAARKGQPAPKLESVTARQAFNALANELEKREMAGEIEIVASARVPIIKFRDRETGLSVDICFNNESGLATAALMSRALETMPALRPLVLVVKYFLHCRGLSETYQGGVGSFFAQLLAIAALQHHPSRFVSRELNEENIRFESHPGLHGSKLTPELAAYTELLATTTRPIHPWRCPDEVAESRNKDIGNDQKEKKEKKERKEKLSEKQEKKQRKERRIAEEALKAIPKVAEIDYKVNLGVLLYSFFNLFISHFNYNKVGISVEGRGSLFCKQTKGWSNPGRPSLLSVENPCDTSHDVGANSFNIAKVRKAFIFGAHTIAFTVHERAREEALRNAVVSSYSADGTLREFVKKLPLEAMVVTEERVNLQWKSFQRRPTILQQLLPFRPEISAWRMNLPDGAERRALRRAQKQARALSQSGNGEESDYDSEDEIKELDGIIAGNSTPGSSDPTKVISVTQGMIDQLDFYAKEEFDRQVLAFKHKFSLEQQRKKVEKKLRQQQALQQQQQQIEKQQQLIQQLQLQQQQEQKQLQKQQPAQTTKLSSSVEYMSDSDQDDINNDDYMSAYAEFITGTSAPLSHNKVGNTQIAQRSVTTSSHLDTVLNDYAARDTDAYMRMTSRKKQEVIDLAQSSEEDSDSGNSNSNSDNDGTIDIDETDRNIPTEKEIREMRERVLRNTIFQAKAINRSSTSTRKDKKIARKQAADAEELLRAEMRYKKAQEVRTQTHVVQNTTDTRSQQQTKTEEKNTLKLQSPTTPIVVVPTAVALKNKKNRYDMSDVEDEHDESNTASENILVTKEADFISTSLPTSTSANTSITNVPATTSLVTPTEVLIPRKTTVEKVPRTRTFGTDDAFEIVSVVETPHSVNLAKRIHSTSVQKEKGTNTKNTKASITAHMDHDDNDDDDAEFFAQQRAKRQKLSKISKDKADKKGDELIIGTKSTLATTKPHSSIERARLAQLAQNGSIKSSSFGLTEDEEYELSRLGPKPKSVKLSRRQDFDSDDLFGYSDGGDDYGENFDIDGLRTKFKQFDDSKQLDDKTISRRSKGGKTGSSNPEPTRGRVSSLLAARVQRQRDQEKRNNIIRVKSDGRVVLDSKKGHEKSKTWKR